MHPGLEEHEIKPRKALDRQEVDKAIPISALNNYKGNRLISQTQSGCFHLLSR
jgi:hypothetical protein